MKYKVIMTLRSGVKDNQGSVVARVLAEDLGFPEVKDVRIGRAAIIEVPDGTPEDYIHEICKKKLVNTVIEDYTIEVV